MQFSAGSQSLVARIAAVCKTMEYLQLAVCQQRMDRPLDSACVRIILRPQAQLIAVSNCALHAQFLDFDVLRRQRFSRTGSNADWLG